MSMVLAKPTVEQPVWECPHCHEKWYHGMPDENALYTEDESISADDPQSKSKQYCAKCIKEFDTPERRMTFIRSMGWQDKVLEFHLCPRGQRFAAYTDGFVLDIWRAMRTHYFSELTQMVNRYLSDDLERTTAYLDYLLKWN